MKKYFIELVMIVVLPVYLFSQNPSQLIDKYLQNMYASNKIPGFSVVLVRGNKVLFSKGYGVERIGEKQPFTTQSVTAVGSLTKSFTALAALKLVEKGQLDLDIPIVKYILWFRTANKEVSDKITMRMLLNNTSGLYPSSSNPSYDLTVAAAEKYVRSLSSIYVNKIPGNSYEYSNAGFVVAGYLISKISGISYPDFVEKEILQPLKMKHTSTKPEVFNKWNAVVGHYPSIQSVILAHWEPEFETGEYISAGSLLNSNAEDLGKYLIALINDNPIISRNIKSLMWKPYVSFPGLSKENGGDGSAYSYGLGWMQSNIEGRNIIHHGGSTGKTSSFTMIDTANKLGASILMNFDMTLIDKYTYTSEITILNNVLRMAVNMPLSDFGKPIVKDPTHNNYEIPDNKKIRYQGQFNLSSGGDAWVYYGVDLRIERNSKGDLEGIFYRGAQIVNRFTLDFVNESVAITRNVGIAGYLHFKLTPSGEVTAAYFRNMEFKKISSLINSRFREIRDTANKIRFSIPKNWEYKYTNDLFSGSDSNHKVKLTGSVMSNRNTDFDSLFTQITGVLVSRNSASKIISSNIGSFVWQQKTYLVRKDKGIIEYILLVSKSYSKTVCLILEASKDKFMDVVHKELDPIIKSFRWLENFGN